MRYFLCLLLALPLAVPAQEPEPSFRTTASEVLLDVVVRDKKAHIVRDLRPEEFQVFENGVPQKVRRCDFFDGHEKPEAPQASPAPATGAASAITPPQAPSVQELRDASVVSVVVANLDPRGRKLAVDTMHAFIKDEMGPNTYVGVYTLDTLIGLRRVQPYTNDAERVANGMERAASIVFHERPRLTAQEANSAGTDTAFQPDTSNDQPVTQANASTQGPAQLINQITEADQVSGMHDVYQDSVRYLTSLRALVESQSGIPGRKVVLLFSSGLPIHFDTVEPLQNLISTANRSNVSVYAVDTAGFTSQSDMDNSRRMLQAAAAASMRRQRSLVNGGDQSVTPMEAMVGEWAEGAVHSNTRGNLAQLAEGTGGALLSDSLDLRDPLRRAMEEVRTHYELSYAPTNGASDGTFRKIEVKVSRPGVTGFARSGYYALPVLNGHQIYPFEMATMKAINTKPQLRQFEFHDAAFQFRPGPVRNQLAFVFEAPASGLSINADKTWAKIHLSVTALIKNDQGQVIEKISKDIPYQVPASRTDELRRGVVTFTAPFQLPPGRYTIETAAVDRESMKASVRRSSLAVEEAAGFAMSDVAVIRRVDATEESPNATDPLEMQGAKVTPELLDAISPETNGQVKFYAVAYPTSPIDAPVEVSVEIWRDGQMIVRTPASAVAPDPSGAASMLASIPVEKLPAGHYEAQVSFQYKGQTVSKVTTFAVGAGS